MSKKNKLPGYVNFTKYVAKKLWSNRKIMVLIAVSYVMLSLLLVGISSQDAYSTLANTLNTAGGDTFVGAWGQINKAGWLFLATLTGSISQNLTESQQIYAMFVTLLIWLTSIWVLRNTLAGHKVKLRDGLYNCGSPILSTFMVVLLMVLQLLPFALALIGYSALSSTGILSSFGAESVIFWIVAGSLVSLSLYWITSTIFALIIVTIPGMYPMRAIKTASNLVAGQRLQLLLRLVWLAISVMVVWIIVMMLIILVDMWLKNILLSISWLPLVPVALLILSALTIVWVSSYVYLLYRKVVTDDVSPS